MMMCCPQAQQRKIAGSHTCYTLQPNPGRQSASKLTTRCARAKNHIKSWADVQTNPANRSRTQQSLGLFSANFELICASNNAPMHSIFCKTYSIFVNFLLHISTPTCFIVSTATFSKLKYLNNINSLTQAKFGQK